MFIKYTVKRPCSIIFGHPFPPPSKFEHMLYTYFVPDECLGVPEWKCKNEFVRIRLFDRNHFCILKRRPTLIPELVENGLPLVLHPRPKELRVTTVLGNLDNKLRITTMLNHC